MHFLFPSLAVGFVLLAAPFLVHLINLFRHRRQEWAAMEFLMAAYRKQRKWVVLKQLLLLALRTAAIGILVAMLAGWVSGSRLLDALGGNTQHHLIILDDSFSMEDRSGGGNSAYQRGLAALDGFVKGLLEDPGSHQLTVLRTSRAELAVKSGQSAGDAAADLSDQTILPGDRSLERVMATTPSPLATSLEPALQLAANLVELSTADQTNVYLLTDLRARQWQAGRRLSELFGDLSRQRAEVKLIDCGTDPNSNLSVSELAPIEDVWAAGVPVRMRVRVQNHSDQPITEVPLSVSVVRYGDSTTPVPEQAQSGSSDALPDVLFERIEANSDAVKVFQVYIPEPGTHAVRVKLPDDALAIDNLRACTLPLVATRRMLLVQGGGDDQLSYYIRSAINPGGAIRTGWSIEVRSTTYLSTASIQDLAEFDNVWLLDVPAVDGPIATALKGYVERGGGLGIWLGPSSQIESYNQFLGGTAGLIPGKLLPATPVKHSANAQGGDLTFDAPHSITAPLAAIGPAMLDSIRVQQAFGWEPSEEGIAPAILLRLPDKRPLAMIRRVGAGQALVMTSALDRRWTNWPADPSFVVFVLQAAAELGQGNRPPTHFEVGNTVSFKLNETALARTAELYPATSPPRSAIETLLPVVAEGVAPEFTVNPAAMMMERSGDYTSLLNPGVAELWLTRLDGKATVMPLAMTVDANEGDLRRIERGALKQAIRPATLEVLDAAALSQRGDTTGSSARVLLLLALLAALLFGEQAAAFAASYHARPTPALRGTR